MDMPSDPPTLVDTTTGSEYRRWQFEGVEMTVEITKHPYRQLAGSSFVTLDEEVRALVNDERWERVLGMNFILPGGCEVDVDDAELERALEDIEGCDENWEDASTRRPDLFHSAGGGTSLGLLVPCRVNDSDLPPVRVLVPLQELRKRCQPVELCGGKHARGTTAETPLESSCKHTGKEFGRTNCRSCMRRFWTMRAKEMGVIDG